MFLKDRKSLRQADIVCSKIYITGYQSNGRPMIEAGTQKIFDGFAIVLTEVDREISDPTCEVMLSSGKIMRIKEERLEIVGR